jgi:hypothetical protein
MIICRLALCKEMDEDQGVQRSYISCRSIGGILHYTAELANAVSKRADVVILKPEDSNDRLFLERVTIVKAFKPPHFSRQCLARAFSLSNIKSLLRTRCRTLGSERACYLHPC